MDTLQKYTNQEVLSSFLKVDGVVSDAEKSIQKSGASKAKEAALREKIVAIKELIQTEDDPKALASYEYSCLMSDYKRVSDPRQQQTITEHKAAVEGATVEMERLKDPNYPKQLANMKAEGGRDFTRNNVVDALNRRVKSLGTDKNSKDASPAMREYYQVRIDLLKKTRELYMEEIERLRNPESVITKDERAAIVNYEKGLIVFKKTTGLSGKEAENAFRDKNPEVKEARDKACERESALKARAQVRSKSQGQQQKLTR